MYRKTFVKGIFILGASRKTLIAILSPPEPQLDAYDLMYILLQPKFHERIDQAKFNKSKLDLAEIWSIKIYIAQNGNLSTVLPAETLSIHAHLTATSGRFRPLHKHP
jgi:hypothetical protein